MKSNMKKGSFVLFIGLISLTCKAEAYNVFENIQNLFQQIDFRQNFDQVLKDVQTTEKWEALDSSYFTNVPKEKLSRIIRDGRNIAERTRAQVKSELAKLETNYDSIVSKMRSSSISDSELEALKNNLPNPRTWNEDSINKIGAEPLKKLSNKFLLEVTDKKAIKRMINQVETLSNSENDPMKKKKLENLFNNLIQKLSVEAKNWNEIDARNFPLNKLTPELIMKMNSNLVSIINESLANEARKRGDCKFGRQVVKRLLDANIKKDSTFVDFGIFLEKLGPELQKYVFPEDIKADVRYITLVEDVMRKNVRNCMQKGEISSKSRSLYRLNYDTKTVTSSELNSEGACAIGVMSLGALHSSLELLNDGLIQEMDKCIIGADEGAKRTALVMHHQNKFPLSRNVVYSNRLPDNLLKYGTRYGGVLQNDALNILQKDGLSLTDGQMEKLTSKSGTTSINPRAHMSKASIPLSTINKMNGNELINVVKSMSGQSLPCVKATMTSFGTKTNISLQQLLQNRALLRCMSTMDAKKLDLSTSPFEVARQLGNERLSTSFAMELRDRLTNATVGSNNRRKAVSKFSISDIDNIPVSVMATFGTDLNGLGEDEREFLLMKMGKMEQLSEIPVSAQKIIVKLGLQTKKRGNSLMAGDVDLVGNCYMLIPPHMLQNANDATKALFLDRVNDDIKDGKLNIFCITSAMNDVIANIIRDVFGEPHKLDSMDGIDCLMWAPSWNYLQAIPKEVLDDATCKLPIVTSYTMETAESNCLEANGMYYMNTLQMEKQLGIMQKKSLITVMERTVDMGSQRSSKKLELTPCEKGAILGLDNTNSGDLSKINKENVMKCVPYLGMMDMSYSKAKSLVDKIFQLSNPSQLTELELTQMGSVFKGFSPDQINKMNRQYFRPENEVVKSIGEIKLGNNQVKAVAEKIKSNINSLSTISSHDLISLGNIICGFKQDDLKEIPFQSAQDAIPMFKRITCSDENFNRALEGLMYRVHGNSQNLDAAKLRDMGTLTNKMPPEYFKNILSKAYSGIMPSAMKMMTPEQLNAMSADGLANLQYETAAIMSSYQMDSLQGEKLKAVVKARSLYGGAVESTASLVFVLSSIFITKFL